MSMMKGFTNVFHIPELRKKIMITLGLVFVCRLISQVPTPGVEWTVLGKIIKSATESSGGCGLIGWLEIFTGGAIGQCAIGTLSIWPYISAQIVIQLLSSVIPSLSKLKKEGENGRQQLAQITRYLTIFLCVIQAWGIATALSHPGALGFETSEPIVRNPGLAFNLMTVIGMTAASLFVMWIADQITTFGVGNGGSLIIMINITSRLPSAIFAAWERYFGINGDASTAQGTYAELGILICFFLLVVMGTVMLTQGLRKIPIHSARRSVVGGANYGMQQTFLPLRVSYAGVMPIIFAQPLIQLPSALLVKIFDKGAVHDFFEGLSRSEGISFAIVYAVLILFFTFFWVATQFNAIDISENLKKDSSYVPGFSPGRATAEYLDDVMTKITLIGGLGLLTVAIVPMMLTGVFHIPQVIASFFGGTSLLIIVGVALDTLRVMESHLLVRKYEGFLSHGSLRGRGGI